MTDFRKMWTELGMDVELHDQLIADMSNLHKKTHLSQQNRPKTIERFDRSFHSSHSGRVAEILDFRKKGGKVIGTFCIFVPDEIALAAGVLPLPLCGGSGWAVSYADKLFPRDICPLIRATFGMALSKTCPYASLEDFSVGETTCDAKKKTWDLLGMKVMEVPQRRNEADRRLWLEEVYKFKDMVEELSGVIVTADGLLETIKLVNQKRSVLRQIDEFRKLDNPPISGLDALLVAQVSMNQDIHAFIQDAQSLIEELQDRADKNISAYSEKGQRVLIAGSPSPLGYAKVHHVIESSGLHIVADESCTGLRYFRDFVNENLNDLDEMIRAVADRYFDIDCACFSPNTERIENIQKLVKDYNVKGVV
ncbi:MAG: 2-hydroxyacyl-CoA dehydratase family protein, partial [Candidatus Aminicenantes bacterium]|nr:2-hydroxyacyl-CoA dehydratase family protein [Candidatus Aminicenantes bacterium]